MEQEMPVMQPAIEGIFIFGFKCMAGGLTIVARFKQFSPSLVSFKLGSGRVPSHSFEAERQPRKLTKSL
jgi:hypothetical protein